MSANCRWPSPHIQLSSLEQDLQINATEGAFSHMRAGPHHHVTDTKALCWVWRHEHTGSSTVGAMSMTTTIQTPQQYGIFQAAATPSGIQAASGK